MGNAIQKRFNLPTNHTATAGHVNNWKIWPGKGKDGGPLVSIWAFDKTDLAKRKHNPVSDKTIVEQIFQIMKRDFTVIKDSKACSNIIQILEVVEDSKTSIAFTTERIVCSLADVLNNFENIPGGAAEHASFFESGASLSEMEITRGLLNITLALQYLHTVQRKLHLNLTPEDIVITATGQWKLCGFGFALAFLQGETQRLASPYFMQASPITTTSVVSRLEPDLRYAAPECTEGGFNPPGVRYLTPVADMFSLGLVLVFYEIYRFNLKLTPSERSYSRPLVMVTNNDAMQHMHALAILQGTDYSFMPQGAASIISSIMNPNAQFRGTTTDIVNNSYFVTGSQAVLNMIESMHTRDLGTQSSQLLSLQPELVSFPPRMLIHSVIPAISKLCVNAPNLWVYALPLHAELSALLTQDKYVYFAGPYLAQGLTNLEAPNDTIQVFLSSVQFICRYFGSDFFQANVTTLFCNALEKPNLYLQNLALEKLSEQYVYTLFSTTSLVDKLMPILCKIACKNPEPSVKIQSLYIISLLTHKLDEAYIAKNILASLKYIADHEKNPQVSMSVVGNFESISNSLGLTYVATSVLPILQNMLLDSGLDRMQFEIVVNMIKRLLKKILDKRTEELKMPAISVGEVHGSEVVDPFSTAKQLIQQSKDKNIASNYGLIIGSYKMFSGERVNTVTNSGINSAYTVTAPVKYAPMNSSGLAPANMESGKINLSGYEGSYGSSSINGGASGLSRSVYSAPLPTALPPAPSKAPPPPPSAPPPSFLPPTLPVAGTVGGFGAEVNSTPSGPAASFSISYGSTSSLSLPPAPASYGGTYGSNLASTYTAPTVATASTGGYQPSFSSNSGSMNNSAVSTPAAGVYGAPLTLLDSGLPGFGSSTSAPAQTSMTGMAGCSGSSTATVTEKKSMFSFFSGSGSTTATKKPTESDLYVPPVVSGANYPTTSMSNNAGVNGGGGVPDLDDFLSSFGNKAPASTMGGGSSATSNNGNGIISMGGGMGTASTSIYNSTSHLNTASSAAYGNNNNMSTKSTTSVNSAASGASGGSGLSIEQQIAQAQLEIARLSATNTSNAPSAYTAPVNNTYVPPAAYNAPTQPPQYGYSAHPNAVPNTGVTGNMYGNTMTSGAYAPPQPYTATYPTSNSYVPPSANTYTAPSSYAAPNAYNQGSVPGYAYNAGGNNNMNAMNNNNNMGRNTGYMPPQQGNTNYSTQPSKTDAFDFLN